MTHSKGFTLVELAIVLMIIGLLIGGILKGQELITNARITMSIRQVKSLDAAVITFQDSYGALPGDIQNPATRIPNCSAARCNIAGNGNGILGTVNTSANDENNTFWLHLSAANLISGIDSNSTWTSGNYLTASVPTTTYGGKMVITQYDSPISGTWPEGLFGIYYYVLALSPTGTVSSPLPISIISRLDTKFDDGKPRYGTVRIAACDSLPTATSYGTVSDSNMCRYLVQAQY